MKKFDLYRKFEYSNYLGMIWILLIVLNGAPSGHTQRMKHQMILHPFVPEFAQTALSCFF